MLSGGVRQHKLDPVDLFFLREKDTTNKLRLVEEVEDLGRFGEGNKYDQSTLSGIYKE